MGDPTTWQRDETPKTFFNPLLKDITVAYRNDDNIEENYVISSYLPSTHPTYLADVLINHLVDAVINERNLGYLTPEKREEIRKEITDGRTEE